MLNPTVHNRTVPDASLNINMFVNSMQHMLSGAEKELSKNRAT
jgi:hypothetical protein